MISIKSQSEIDLMKKAGHIVALVLEKVEENVQPGITTAELDRIAEEVIRKHGAVPSFKGYSSGMRGVPDFPASICASFNEEVVHGIPGLRALADGDIISIDVGVYLNGYHGDAGRTFGVGNISEEARKLIRVTEECFFEGIRHAVEGNRIVDISGSIEDHARKNGFSVVKEFIGHGIGQQLHEAPEIPNYRTRYKGPRLEKGMALAVEPMVNAGGSPIKVLDNGWTVVTSDGKLSAYYENTIAVTDAEPIILTMR